MSMATIAIIDTQCANITSVKFAIERLGYRVEVTTDAQRIQQADKVILPGVGHAKPAMQNIQALGLVEVIQQLTQPVLGICLGMQLMTQHSAEGDVQCLGLIPLRVTEMSADQVRLPHMGWNNLGQCKPHPVLAGIDSLDYVYFVHSFAVVANNGSNTPEHVQENIIASCEYGQQVAAVISHNNFIGMQFHPERSGPVGRRLLQNFLELSC